MADVRAYILLSEDPFFGFINVDVGTIFIADASILTNEIEVGNNAREIGSTKKALKRVDGFVVRVKADGGGGVDSIFIVVVSFDGFVTARNFFESSTTFSFSARGHVFRREELAMVDVQRLQPGSSRQTLILPPSNNFSAMSSSLLATRSLAEIDLLTIDSS